MSELAFGSLRLNRDKDGNILSDECKELIDKFLSLGGKYFEVAYIYRQTEEAICSALSAYPRDSYVLTDKMPINSSFIHEESDYYRIFDEQLEKCGVDYFDYYLLHNVGLKSYHETEKYNGFYFLSEIKRRGQARKVGFSFHDKAIVLEEILAKYGKLIDVVQLQINYLDWNNGIIQSKQCYEIARKYNKEIFVMEPIKGGRLINLPKEAKDIIKNHTNRTPAELALKFCSSLEGVKYILSGMNAINQIEDNIKILQDNSGLNHNDYEAISRVVQVINQQRKIECTNCGYCVKVCPKKIPIPELFNLYDSDNVDRVGRIYGRITEDVGKGKASDCLKCGRCENECSQKLPIRKLLEMVKDEYERKEKVTVKNIIKKIIGKKATSRIKKVLKR